jgi:hypothetical protein
MGNVSTVEPMVALNENIFSLSNSQAKFGCYGAVAKNISGHITLTRLSPRQADESIRCMGQVRPHSRATK